MANEDQIVTRLRFDIFTVKGGPAKLRAHEEGPQDLAASGGVGGHRHVGVLLAHLPAVLVEPGDRRREDLGDRQQVPEQDGDIGLVVAEQGAGLPQRLGAGAQDRRDREPGGGSSTRRARG